MLDIENFDRKFNALIATPAFEQAKKAYAKAKHVFYFGHGGNMGVAEHAAIDASRLTDKSVHAPGGGVMVTSIQGDTNFNDWIMHWLDIRTRFLNKEECFVIGLSCSTNGISSDCVTTALNWAADNGIPCSLWAAAPKEGGIRPEVIQVIQHAKYYHTSELLSLAMTYELIDASGHMCPTIAKKAQLRRFETLGIEPEIGTSGIVFDANTSAGAQLSAQNVPPGMESQLKNLAIDLDGVIHTFDKGWHDGTCYGDPIPAAIEAIKSLSLNWNIIVFSAKVRPDRPLVDGKTGYELVEEWLERYEIRDLISEITHEKPRAQYYIDDKAIAFADNWDDILERLK
tara:strand:- start:2594 stop:3619 length:1026 start_codon:yes stop_codon:yes gene_type:complete